MDLFSERQEPVSETWPTSGMTRNGRPIDALADGLRWTRDPDQLAEHLWVDVPTVRTRLGGLDPIEVAQLEHALDGEWIP